MILNFVFRAAPTAAVLLAVLLGAPEVDAQRSREVPTEIVVVGSREAVQHLPGAGAYIDAESFSARGYDDINRALRRTQGVYMREEDGFGLFPNISLRGVDSQRTSKLTVLEDGVLTAPAAYSAPAAYYTPTTARMQGIEVLMGSSQTRFGPHTTGGVINYRSTAIPEAMSGRLAVSFGSANELRNHFWIGNTWSTEHGTFGVMGEHYFRHSDGFKKIRGGD